MAEDSGKLLDHSFGLTMWRFHQILRANQSFQYSLRFSPIHILTAIQNSMSLNFKFFIWDLQIFITALIAYSSIIGSAIVAILALPELGKKSLHERRMNKEIHKLIEER